MKTVILFAAAIMILLASPTHLYSEERGFLPSIVIPAEGSQFFCGYCHILTYPRVMKKAHDSWKTGKHKDISCKECHYPPEELNVTISGHEKILKEGKAALEKETELEFMKTELEVLSKLITILNMDGSVIRTKPRIDDRSCTTSKCHPTTGEGKEGEFWTKKINFVESEREDKTKRVITYVHKTHFDNTKFVEGQEMHCTTCHQRETEKRHFEVSKEKCFLCHFKNAELNEGRAMCSLCHEIPTKSLQNKKPEEGAKLITHQTVIEDKVPCYSCHYDVTQGKGEIKRDNCFECHDNEESVTKEVFNKKLMHEQHVAGQNASCFNCHESIQHRKTDFLEAGRKDCSVCHPDHHEYQKVLLTGAEREDVSETPALMQSVRTGCLGCHMEERVVKGEIVLQGDSRTCSRCHVEKTAGMVKQWKENINTAMEEAKELEVEAKGAIEEAKGKVSDEKLKEAMTLFINGQQSVLIVEAGGGVHNQKYAIQILDITMGYFEDAIDLLTED